MPTPRIVPELYCSDLAASLRFYTEVVGFTVRYERPEEQFAYLDLSGAELMLDHAHDLSRCFVNGEPTAPSGWGLNLQIEVENVESIHERVLAAGLSPFLPLEDRWYRRTDDEVGVRQFVAADPDGYLLRVQENLGVRSLDGS